MPAKLDLPDAEIVRLVDEEGLSYFEVKDRLGLGCHEDTIGRHYRKFKKEQKQETESASNGLSVFLWEKFKDWLSRLF